MRKKNKRNNNVFNHVIYPKELSGYIITTLFCLVISFIMLYFELSVGFSEKVSRAEVFQVIISTVIILCPNIYFVLTLYMLLYKKIYIETTEDYLKVKTFRTQIVKISEIDSIEEKSEYRSSTKIIIKTKTTIDRKDSTTIRIPIIWFSSNDLNDLIYHLRKRNRNIYYRTYRVSTHTVKKKPYVKDKFNK